MHTQPEKPVDPKPHASFKARTPLSDEDHERLNAFRDTWMFDPRWIIPSIGDTVHVRGEPQCVKTLEKGDVLIVEPDGTLSVEPCSSKRADTKGRPMVGMGSKRISVTIERELLGDTDDLADELGISRSALIARGLRAQLVAARKA